MKFRRLVALVTALILSASCFVSAYATEWTNDEIEDRIFAKQIIDNNLYVEQLWQRALAKSTSGIFRMNDAQQEIEAVPFAILRSASTTHYQFYGFSYLGILFKATVSTSSDFYGNEVIDSVRTINATGTSNRIVVTIDDYAYTLIDNGRTIATRYSCTLGTRARTEDPFTYFSYDYYVEFYVNGGAMVY